MSNGHSAPQIEWFRKSTWTAEDRAEFDARLGDCPSDAERARCLRTQAQSLLEVGRKGFVRSAIKLLTRGVEEFPLPSEFAITYRCRAECYLILNRRNTARADYRRSLAAQREFPAADGGAALSFAWEAARRRIRRWYLEALEALREFVPPRSLHFPIHLYRYHAALAFIAAERGKKKRARRYARVALEAESCPHSGLRYQPLLGLVDETHRRVQARLKKLAAH